MRRTRTVFRNEEIPGRIHALLPFLSEGKLPDGTRRWWAVSGPAVQLGHLPAQWRESVRSAVYVVYSYDTPIGWVLEVQRPGGDDYEYVIPDVGYSLTTGQHQYAVMEAWAEARRRQGKRKYERDGRREIVDVPANAEVYGQPRRVRAGGMDGARPGSVVGRSRHDLDNEEYGGYVQSPPERGWTGHRSHP